MNDYSLPETAKIFVFPLSKMVFRNFLMISAAFTQQYTTGWATVLFNTLAAYSALISQAILTKFQQL